jgi:hypothetical protein
MTTESITNTHWKLVDAGPKSITSWSRGVLIEVGEEMISLILMWSDFDGYTLTFDFHCENPDVAEEIIQLAEQDDLYELDLLTYNHEGDN